MKRRRAYQSARAVWEAVYGNAAEAKTNAIAALALSNGRDVEYAVGSCAGLLRETPLDRKRWPMIWNKRFPEDTFVRFTYLPVLRALSALRARASPRKAWSGCKSLCTTNWL